MNLQNKIALITGGSRGLGKEMALTMAAHGADIIITYQHKAAEAEAVAAAIIATGRQALALQLDVADTTAFPHFNTQVKTTLQQYWKREQLDILVNNAGIDAAAPFVSTTEENFDRLFQIHFKGAFFLTQQLLPLIADKGRIVNVSTGLTRFSTPGYIAYASMKGAIEVFTRYLAKELGHRGITVNAIAPGAIDTDFLSSAVAAHPELKSYLGTQTALGRLGVPEDIGGVVAMLCSEEGRWITAQRLEASGGMFL